MGETSEEIIFEDIPLKCIVDTCLKDFVWGAGEQKFLRSLYDGGQVNSFQQPRRCPACRLKKRAEREALAFNQNQDEVE